MFFDSTRSMQLAAALEDHGQTKLVSGGDPITMFFDNTRSMQLAAA